MEREPTAIYIGNHKIGYRGNKDGVRGLMYIKGNVIEFKSCDRLLQDLYAGPCKLYIPPINNEMNEDS